MAIKHTLDLNTEALGNCLLSSYNTGITKLLHYDQSFIISQFNAPEIGQFSLASSANS